MEVPPRERNRAYSGASASDSMESSHPPIPRYGHDCLSSQMPSTLIPDQPTRDCATSPGVMAPASPTRPPRDLIRRRPQGLSDQSGSQPHMDRRTSALLWLYAFVFVAMLGFVCFNPTSYRPMDIGVLRGRSILYNPQQQASLSDQLKGKF